MIKELKDVLVLVEQLPRDYQLKCVRALAAYVDGWEARQQEPQLSDHEWNHVLAQRRMQRLEESGKRLRERWRRYLE